MACRLDQITTSLAVDAGYLGRRKPSELETFVAVAVIISQPSSVPAPRTLQTSAFVVAESSDQTFPASDPLLVLASAVAPFLVLFACLFVLLALCYFVVEDPLVALFCVY